MHGFIHISGFDLMQPVVHAVLQDLYMGEMGWTYLTCQKVQISKHPKNILFTGLIMQYCISTKERLFADNYSYESS